MATIMGWFGSRRVHVALGLALPVLIAALALASRIPDALPPVPALAAQARATPTPVLLAAAGTLPAPPASSGGAVAPVAVATREVPGIKVYVSGAVLAPGVYRLTTNDRVEDALRAAGGADENADLTRLNLAQRLRDEQQINVPLRTEPAAAAAVAGGGATGTAAGAADEGPIDVNTATLAQLDALPGIGPTTARRILDYRAQHGPFARPDDLRTLKLVTASVYERIKDRITAR